MGTSSVTRPDPAALRWVAAVLRRIAREMSRYDLPDGVDGLREVADWLDHEAGPKRIQKVS